MRLGKTSIVEACYPWYDKGVTFPSCTVRNVQINNNDCKAELIAREMQKMTMMRFKKDIGGSSRPQSSVRIDSIPGRRLSLSANDETMAVPRLQAGAVQHNHAVARYG